MKKIYIDGKFCIGPTFSKAEFALIKRNLAEQKGLKTLADSLGVAGLPWDQETKKPNPFRFGFTCSGGGT